jgi:hypothetical protein
MYDIMIQERTISGDLIKVMLEHLDLLDEYIKQAA